MTKLGWVLLGALSLAGGCSSRQSPAPGPALGAATPPRADERRLPWGGYEEALALPPVQDRWLRSRGHGAGGWSIQIRTDPASAESYRALSLHTRFDPGTVLVAVHRSAAGEPGPIFAMTRTADATWSYVAADPNGSLTRGADLALCARCHAEAPHGQLFGLPSDTEPTDEQPH